jgi:hypothetical protein
MKVDEISQAERRRILAEDRRARTYFSEAQANADLELGGRYAKVTTTTVVGTGPIQYPRLPLAAPANQAAMVGDEPPLGIDINAMEPVGEIHERGDAAAPKPGDGDLRLGGWRRL